MQSTQGTLGRQCLPARHVFSCFHRPSTFRVQISVNRLLQPTASSSSRCLTVKVAATAAAIEEAAPAVDTKGGVAHLKGVRGSSTKFRRVLDQIRGRTYEEALLILEYLPYRACEDILTTLISAASNAKHNQGATKSNLVVVECYANEAGHFKRFQPRAKGKPYRIQVKKSHLTIRVEEQKNVKRIFK